jgi:Family of unknown function (DUF6308)
VSFRLPVALHGQDNDAALALLGRYYGPVFGAPLFYGGAAFDTWDSTGTRAADVDRFTADDLVAITFLSVEASANAAHALLHSRRGEFSDLLIAVGPDRDLVDEPEPFGEGSPQWGLMAALRSLDRVGPTIASKLFARKRPRLRPIYDSVVAAVTGTQQGQWEPLRQALRADDRQLHTRLLRLRAAAGLSEQISPLRVFDVITWLEGKDQAA